ncbi:hypothetical protein F2Q70_00008964 [Brassica cretica]|uniref:Uncharacterized protein n=1 Tax=Brassica cretica TaxID=69181 RepID=A0A8S9JMX9_BRACR|nr:hypothetical protein F2Q68_00002027 [Brassica cretica]KAF2609602.1 hypothetical protein F2Q70_00008964 [Brassica cretica]
MSVLVIKFEFVRQRITTRRLLDETEDYFPEPRSLFAAVASSRFTSVDGRWWFTLPKVLL